MKLFVMITAAAALLTAASVPAEAQGINFRSLTFDEALAAAVKEGRPIFLDCYTTWCGPCKVMAETVFTLPRAGDYFNPRYVCMTMDMEKGEGVELVKRYGIKSYPTFLIIGADGREIHRVVGGSTIDDFISRVEAGMTGRSEEELAAKYAAGTATTAELTDYWLLLRARGRSAADLSTAAGGRLWSVLTDAEKMQQLYWPLVREKAAAPDGADMAWVLAHREELYAALGREQVDRFIFSAFNLALLPMVANPLQSGQKEALPEIAARVEANPLSGKEELQMLVSLAEARTAGDVEGFFAFIEQNLEHMPANMLSSAMGGALDLIEGPDIRKHYARMHQIALHSGSSRGDYYLRMSHTGVYWREIATFDEAVATATREHRRIFLYLQRGGGHGILSDAEIGDLVNQRFVAMRIDAKSREGTPLAEKFGLPRGGIALLNYDGTLRGVITELGRNPQRLIEQISAISSGRQTPQ